MQDKDNNIEIDNLVSEILNGKSGVSYGEANDVDAILSKLNQDTENIESTNNSTANSSDNAKSIEETFFKQDEKAAKFSEEFMDTFAAKEAPPKRKEKKSTVLEPQSVQAPPAKKQAAQKMRDKLLNVAAAAGWGDDDYEDSYDDIALEEQAFEQSKTKAAPEPKAPKEPLPVNKDDEKTEAKAADEISEESEEPKEPTVELPTLEFEKQELELEIAAKRKAKAAAFVLRPDGKDFLQKPSNPLLANEVDDAFREFFGETVAVNREELEIGLKGKKAGKIFHNLFGARSAQTGSFDEPEIDDAQDLEDEISQDEYNSPADAEAVASTLKSMRSTATLRVIATALTSLLLLYLGLSSRTGLLPPIAALDPTTKPLLFLLANFSLLLITALVAINTMTSGIIGLFKEASADSLPAIATLGALLQNAYFIFKADTFAPEKITLFAPVAAILLFANAIGKRTHCNVVYNSFDMVSVGHDHSAAYLVKNRDIVERVCMGLGNENEAQLLVSRPTALVKGFLRQSFSSSHNETTAKIMSFVLLGFAFIGAIISYSSSTLISSALTAFAAVLCFAAPVASSLLYAIPCALMQRSAARVGAVVPGWSSIEALGSADAVTVGARDLFPPSTVRLHGIKTFEKERIDLAILYAASVLIAGCDTLRDIFLGVIENKTDMLYKVESLTQETGYGFTAWIEHSRVILGSRDMMLRHEIDIPSLDYELKYTKDERSPIYLAVAGKLFGMFLVSYSADEDAYDVVQSLRHSGVSLVVRADDFNITRELIAKIYDLPAQCVKVLTGDDRDALAPNISYLPESEGIMTHIGTFSSFIGGLRAAEGAAGGVKMGTVVQCAAIILGIVISILLCFTGGIISLSLTAVILYQVAWAALTILMPFLKRY